MDKGKNKSVIDTNWDLFASVKTAVVIFSFIAITSVIGTVLEQNAEPEKNIKILVKMFGVGHETAHSMLGVLDKLGFTNMYHSWWFVALLLLFSANLVICSIDRLPRIWKLPAASLLEIGVRDEQDGEQQPLRSSQEAVFRCA